MRILLVGEFSGLHRELKKGLVQLGHEVTVLAAGDGWKSLECDIKIPTGTTFISKLKAAFEQFKLINSMRDYDVVQFIFPHIFNRLVNSYFINKLISQNKRSFLLAAGSDAFYWKNYEGNFRYSPHVDHLIIDRQVYKSYPVAKWLENWNHRMALNVNAIIPMAYDYKIGYLKFGNLAATIPMPIFVKDIEANYYNISSKKITILYGISRPGFKGSRFIEPALDKIKLKYGDRVEILRPQRLAFNNYLGILAAADIVVDQALTYSYGMNALVAVTMGKVTLSGAEPECIKELGELDCPIINILPSVDDIFLKLAELVENPERIVELSHKSRAYVERVHDSKLVGNFFISTWKSF